MRILSLFDGCAMAYQALKNLGVKVDKYYASEIKKHAIKCALDNHPDIIHLGDVRNIKGKELGKIDLLIGGSPCQDISILKPKNDIYGKKSILFFEYLRLLDEIKPKYFLLENVNGCKKSLDIISFHLGVKPININSKLVSYQQRNRMYWTNIKNIKQPKDRKISFQDYKEKDYNICSEYKVNKTPSRIKMWGDGINGQCPNVTNREKINCITRRQDRRSNSGLVEFEDFCRYLTVRELEQGQTLPVGYTKSLTKSQASDVIGDGFTVAVIEHILRGIL